MRQGQDSQHEEIHGQQEVDVLLGEYLRQKYKEKQEVRVASDYEETRAHASLLELGNGVRKTLKWYWGGGPSSFYGNRKKGRNFKPSDAPPKGVCRFALGGSIICRQAILCACRGSCMGEGSLKFRVPREPSEPQNALFQASFSLLKNLGSPLQRPHS